MHAGYEAAIRRLGPSRTFKKRTGSTDGPPDSETVKILGAVISEEITGSAEDDMERLHDFSKVSSPSHLIPSNSGPAHHNFLYDHSHLKRITNQKQSESATLRQCS